MLTNPKHHKPHELELNAKKPLEEKKSPKPKTLNNVGNGEENFDVYTFKYFSYTCAIYICYDECETNYG
jgi:hypothetical protein